MQNHDDSKQNNWKQNWIHQINIIRELFKLIIVQGKMIMITTEIVVKKSYHHTIQRGFVLSLMLLLCSSWSISQREIWNTCWLLHLYILNSDDTTSSATLLPTLNNIDSTFLLIPLPIIMIIIMLCNYCYVNDFTQNNLIQNNNVQYPINLI